MIIRGAIHIHSHYSDDAKLRISELKDIFKKSGFHFITVNDHTNKAGGNYLNQDELDNLIRECEELNDDGFCAIPGLEIETEENYHILGIGITKIVVIFQGTQARICGSISCIFSPSVKYLY